MELTSPQRHKALRGLLFAGFLFALHAYLPIYITSNFLEGVTSEMLVGILYTAASLVSLGGLWLSPLLLCRWGAYRLIIACIAVAALAALGLAHFTSPFFLIPLFLASTTFIRITNFIFDELVEHYSIDSETGAIRGGFLTAQNIALVLAPLVAGFIVGGDEYWKIFLVAAVILTPLLVLLSARFDTFADPVYTKLRLITALKELRRLPNIRRAVMANLVLRFFYSWMVVYTPIYLHQHIGFSWESIGIMFTIMLLPFALLEYPLGRLADTRFGEKEILTTGFIVIALATAALSFVTTPSLILWMTLLLCTRIGASAVEIMSETYFFKHTNDREPALLSVFRMVDPFAYVIGPLVASVALVFVDIQFLFIILGVLVLWGLRYSLTLKDTR
jgi:MFS family permease